MSGKRAFATVILAALALSSLTGLARAQDAKAIVEQSVVYIKVIWEDLDTGELKAEEGTGFFISDDGQLLTSYHLLESVKNPKEKSVKIGVSIGYRKDNPDDVADVVYALPLLDVLLLKMRPSGRKAIPLKLGIAADLSSQIFTTGFPASLPGVKSYSEEITSRQGPGGTTWLLKGDVEGGQSGSPIYDSKATVIGIMKGVAGKATGAFVPVELAEQLIIPIRLRDLRHEQEKLEARLKEPLDDQVAKYIKGSSGSSTLAGWLRQYLRSKDGAAVIEEEIDEFLAKNIEKVSQKLAKPMDVYMSNVVAYSYSMEFTFRSVVSGSKEKPSAVAGMREPEWRRLSFYKTQDDRGELHCEFSYPPNVDNKVHYKINNKTVPKFVSPNQLTEAGLVQLDEAFDKDFKMYEPGSREEGSPFHKIVFRVEPKPFKGIITAQCTVMVIGAAKRRAASQ